MSSDWAPIAPRAASTLEPRPPPAQFATGEPGETLEALPTALLSVLERGYLDRLDPREWSMTPADEAPHRLKLREIARLGRHRSESGDDRGLSSLLLACAAPGHALAFVASGGVERQRLFVGVRRLPGASISSAEYLDHVASAFKSTYPGLAFADGVSADAGASLDDFCCFSVQTGIPSLMDGHALLPTLEPAFRNLRGARFQINFVAEPLDRATLEQAISGLRRIRSEIHALVRQTESSSQSETRGGGASLNTPGPGAYKAQAVTAGLFGISAALHLAATSTALATLGAAAGPIQALAYVAGALAHRQGGSEGEQSNWSQSTLAGASRERLDAVAEACERIVEQHLKRLERAAGGGFWRVATHIAAASEHDLRRVEGALRGLLTGRASSLDPIRALSPDADLVRDCMRFGRMIALRPESSGPAAPALATAFDQLATCLASHEAAHLFALPESELPGLPIRERAAFSMTAPADDGHSLVIGRVQDPDGRPLAPLPIRPATLNRNALVVGLVGSGKTTTCQRLLTSAFERLGAPFLVVEPVKTEYREMAAFPGLKGRLRVFSAGLDAFWPLRLNPLEPVPGFSVGRHVDLLKAVFNAAFPVMNTGLSFVLEEALIDVYAERGWALEDEAPLAPFAQRASSDKAPFPDLRDLHARVDAVVNQKGYAEEVRANFGAALRSRLNSLLVGQKATLFDARVSTPARLLFDAPAVVELHRLGDDEEKAFAIALLFVLLCEYVEVRQADMPASRRGKLQHLTLIEEAHRLLAAPRGAAASDAGDARGKAVRMFTDLLAELRAYGEGFIVADQIPVKLAPEVLKNTALKISHRLASPDDRHAIAGACNLTVEQANAINLLQPGEAVIHDSDIGEAICARIDPVARPASPAPPPAQRPERPDWLLYGGGCEVCAEPCRWRVELRRDDLAAVTAASLEGFAGWLMAGEPPAADGLFLPTDHPPGRVFCAALQALRGDLANLLRLRHEALGGRGLRPQDHQTIDRALTRLGPSLNGWLRGQNVAEREWRALGEDLAALIEAAPPRRRRGCALCPAPCKGLTRAAGKLAQARQDRLRATVTGPAAPALRASVFANEWAKTLGAPGEEPVVRYCAAVLIGGERPDRSAQEMLAELARLEAAANAES